MVPVEQRIIEEELDILIATRIRQRLQRVLAIGRGVDDVVVGQLGVEHAEAVVVLARDGDVPRPADLASLTQASASNLVGLKRGGSLAYSRIGQLVVVHHPLALAQQGVDAPVDEEAELGILEPLPSRRVALGPGIRGGGGSIVRRNLRRPERPRATAIRAMLPAIARTRDAFDNRTDRLMAVPPVLAPAEDVLFRVRWSFPGRCQPGEPCERAEPRSKGPTRPARDGCVSRVRRGVIGRTDPQMG